MWICLLIALLFTGGLISNLLEGSPNWEINACIQVGITVAALLTYFYVRKQNKQREDLELWLVELALGPLVDPQSPL